MPKGIAKRRVLIGDSRFTALYEVKITQSEAQVIVNKSLAKFFGINSRENVLVRFTGRHTLYRHGKYDVSKHTIICNAIGENVGSVLHELTHAFFLGHGKDFKGVHNKLLSIWEPKYGL